MEFTMGKPEKGALYIQGNDGEYHKVGTVTDIKVDDEFSEFQRAMDHLATDIPTTYEEVKEQNGSK